SYSQSSHKQKFVLNALTLSTLLSSQVSGAHLAPALHHRLGQLDQHYFFSHTLSNRAGGFRFPVLPTCATRLGA
ncbi:MAG: hypothetical protein WAS07_07100, partial [Micropruina sp.]